MSVLGIVGIMAIGVVIGAIAAVFIYRNNKTEVSKYADKADELYNKVEEAIEKTKK